MKYAEHYSKRETPQKEQADPRQVPNSAGGYTFALDDFGRLERFLILGSDGGTYYATERKLTRENAACVERCLDVDAARAVRTIVEVSDAGRAPKNDPAIFALAIAAAHKNLDARRAALAALPAVCRTGTHLFQFVEAVEKMRGWGRALRDAIAGWYESKKADALAYQIVKYQQRGGWSHRDVLRLCHVRSNRGWAGADPAWRAVMRYAVAGIDGMGAREVKGTKTRAPRSYNAESDDALPSVIDGFESLKRAEKLSPADAAAIVRTFGLTHEMVPTEHLAHAEVWDALLEKMPMTAMLRNLGRMSANDLLVPGSDAARRVREQLRDETAIRKARLHPMTVITALKTYAMGRGLKGSLTWSPVKPIVDALDDAFYLAFGNVPSTGKRIMLALDVSGSMDSGSIAGGLLTPREGAAVMALVTARVEPDYDLVGFASGGGGGTSIGGRWGGPSSRLVDVPITAKTSLADAIEAMKRVPMGGTDCALPMLHALERGQRVDAFYIATDNETWHGAIHPHEAMRRYREKHVANAKLIVAGMTATQFTIADPTDRGMLDVVGFDTAAPSVIADFIAH